ncbi:glycoside hydrolase family 31 protein [Formosa sp. 4Alg 33]|uniref:glycoside hydrolase family 31 protein n=1 Tax=Formosa sp. 4Alg 33 TaxID=3382189 RepID=UPI003D9C056C
MKKRGILVLLFMVSSLYAFESYSQEQQEGPFTKQENRLIWENEGQLFWIDAFGENALRFRSSKSLRITDEDWNLLPQPKAQLEITISPKKATVINGDIRAEIESRNGRVTYYNKAGDILLKEATHQHHLHFARQFESKGSDHFELKVTFDADADEHLYGMGQYTNDRLDLKGTVLELAQKNTQISIPFLLSTKGYGFIWNNPAVGRAELSMTHTSFYAEYAKQIDYVIFPGDSPAALVEHYADLTGKSPKMPEYGTGFWQSKLRYHSQEELLNVAREYKKRNLPISVIVADFYHWPVTGDWKFNSELWPDPKAMVEELRSLDIELMVSVWPTLAEKSENYKYFTEHNFTIRPELGNNLFLKANDDLTFVDVTYPKARKAMWSKLKENYFDMGIRMFWMDEAEPEIEPLEYKNIRYYRGNGLEVSNIYPYNFAQAIYEGQQEGGQKEVINLIRSGWIGSQKFGTLLWSGDISGDFPTLRKQVKAGLNIGLAGIPWWNTDIGGFYGSSTSEDYKELLIRWFQFGAFSPVMRMHGVISPTIKLEGQITNSGSPNEVWSFGDKPYKIMSRYLNIREQLRPYIQKHMDIASEKGTPVMRPLFYDYPNDDATYTIDDQYMFGPDILVAPVLEAKAKSRTIYLPEGSKWKDVHSGKTYKGGQTITYKVSIEDIPLFTTNGYNLKLK